MPEITDRVYVALLRGINVGGRNKVPMKDLVAMFNYAGCEHVRTYIQSGNIVFQSPPALAVRIPTVIGGAILDHFGYTVPVVTRSGNEISETAGGNPFLKAGLEPAALHVAFLADLPNPIQVAGLDPNRSSPDKFEVLGKEIYLHCPNGLARTKLTNQYFDSKLATTSTARNWKTVLKLLELSQLP